MSDDYDSPWKDILGQYFAEFMAFFFPKAHAEIDWRKGYESLDTELQQIVRDAESGKRLADKLMKVWRCDGEAQIVYIHIEVQGQVDSAFHQRMYIYHYRLFDRYRRPVVSVAILGDDNPNWRPDRYESELWGCRAALHFPTVKLMDYNTQWPQLEQSANPFAVMVMAHLKTQATRQDAEQRLGWKLALVKSLYQKGFSRQDILELFRFIDWLLYLPNELEQRFDEQLREFEQQMSTPYITSIERRGIEKGILLGRQEGRQEGRIEGELKMLLRQTRVRFGAAVADDLAALLGRISNPEPLAQIGECLIQCESGEDLLARVRGLLEQVALIEERNQGFPD